MGLLQKAEKRDRKSSIQLLAKDHAKFKGYFMIAQEENIKLTKRRV